MITYKTGDILKALDDGEIYLLIHGCNATGAFGSGIAGQIANKYPECKKSYKSFIKQLNYNRINQNDMPGCWNTCVVPNNELNYSVICNLITQVKYLPKGQNHFVYDGFAKGLKNILEQYPTCKIGLPLIGAGLAGGSWKDIEKIINEVSGDREVFVYQLPYHRSV